MGTLVSATYNQSKPAFAVAEVAAGSVTGVNAEINLFYGTSWIGRQVEANNRMADLINALIDDSVPTPFLPGEFTTYDLLLDQTKTDLRKTYGGAVPALSEARIAIFFGETFIMGDSGIVSSGKSQIIKGHAFRMREAYLESSKAA